MVTILCTRMQPAQMPKRTSTNIARKAHAKAEADFATWLMMAKLGSFDDLPPNAQNWLMGYRTRLERMSEAESTAAAIHEIYLAYYAEMGGEGDAPAIARSATPQGEARAGQNVVDLKDVRVARAARATGSSTSARPRRALQPLLIFAGMVVALAAFKFVLGF